MLTALCCPLLSPVLRCSSVLQHESPRAATPEPAGGGLAALPTALLRHQSAQHGSQPEPAERGSPLHSEPRYCLHRSQVHCKPREELHRWRCFWTISFFWGHFPQPPASFPPQFHNFYLEELICPNKELSVTLKVCSSKHQHHQRRLPVVEKRLKMCKENKSFSIVMLMFCGFNLSHLCPFPLLLLPLSPFCLSLISLWSLSL